MPKPPSTQPGRCCRGRGTGPGSGGIVKRASSRIIAASACRVAALGRLDVALEQRALGRVGSAPAAHSAARAGQALLQRARARCSALLTDATLVSSSAAVSFADQPSTSRTISTARGRGGRCWIATMNASSIVSFATTAASGSSSAGRGRVEQLVRERLQPRDLGRTARSAGRPGRAAALARARPGTRSWRSGTARRGTWSGPGTSRAGARRAGTSPGPGPRRPRTSRASGSSGPAARGGAARRPPRTRLRRVGEAHGPL